MTNPTPNFLPEDPDAEATTAPATREVDGEVELDPDAADDQIDSAEADRIASGADEDVAGADDTASKGESTPGFIPPPLQR